MTEPTDEQKALCDKFADLLHAYADNYTFETGPEARKKAKIDIYRFFFNLIGVEHKLDD